MAGAARLVREAQVVRKPLLQKWQGRQDLNSRHLVLETSALPTELHPYKVHI